MTGGNWEPGLHPNAIKKSKLLMEMFTSITNELKNTNKQLSENDKNAINNAITSLAKRESTIYGMLQTFKKYNDLVSKHENTNDETIKKDLDDLNLSQLVEKYNKENNKAMKKSNKVFTVLGGIMNSF